jgi:hypothetical protein
MVITDRDYRILKVIHRFRVVLGRHIKELCGFNDFRACDRRLKQLIDGKYITKDRVLYGVSAIYTLTHKGKVLIGVSKRQDKFRIDQIRHDIIVLDTICYFLKNGKIKLDEIVTEKELHAVDGFSARTHYPDYITVDFEKNEKIAYEIELTPKNKKRFEKNVRDGFLYYNIQNWIVPKHEHKIIRLLEEFKNKYPNIKIIYLDEICTNE